MTRAPHLLDGLARRLDVRNRRGARPHGVRRTDRRVRPREHGRLDRAPQRRFEVTREAQDAVAARVAPARRRGDRGGRVRRRDGRPSRSRSARASRSSSRRTKGSGPTRRSRRLGRLRAAFAEGGSITAGNSSQISDGASAVVLTTRSHADENGWPVLAVVGASGQVAGPDNSLHAQPARAIEKAMHRSRASRRPTSTSSRSTRRSAPSWHGRRRSSDSRTRSSTSTAAASRSVTRSAPRATGSSCTRCTNSSAAAAERRRSRLCGGGGQGDALILTR